MIPYFGTLEKPECHMLYNVTTMATTWHTVATRDVSLLKRQLDIVNSLPGEYLFLNYLRCHDDIGWGLDYKTLAAQGMEERSHKQYLNDYFQGYAGGSNSRGELYNADPVTGDARFCGTTASMCGIERAGFEGNSRMMEQAEDLDIMLHAYMFLQSGIPVLYSGDEIGQVNDYTYKEDPARAEDSRYLHRGKLNWKLTENISNPDTVEGRIFRSLSRLEQIRKKEKVFASEAETRTVETGDRSVLCIKRALEGEEIIGLFNFSEEERHISLEDTEGVYREMLSGQETGLKHISLLPYGFYYLKKI